VRVPADQCGVEDGRGKHVFIVLRQQGKSLRNLSPRQMVEGRPVQLNPAGCSPQSGQRMQAERLAGAIPAQDGDEFAACNRECQARNQPAARHVDVEVLNAQQDVGVRWHRASLA